MHIFCFDTSHETLHPSFVGPGFAHGLRVVPPGIGGGRDGGLGGPDHLGPDGKGGSILVYESTPDYSSPDYDILAPEASASPRRYAHFYLDDEGVCYRVDTNRTLPAPYDAYRPYRWLVVPFVVDVLVYLPLMILGAVLL